MLLPLVAALACALPAPGAPRADARPGAPHVSTPAMSLPLDAGPASLMTELMSRADALWGDRMSHPLAEAPMTPAIVDCVDLSPQPPAPDCMSGPASRWTADMIGSCDLPRASARTVALERARPRPVAGAAAAHTIGAAPQPLAPDHQPWTPLPGVAGRLVHTLFTAALARAPDGTAPSPPSRRIDRPPRA